MSKIGIIAFIVSAITLLAVNSLSFEEVDIFDKKEQTIQADPDINTLLNGLAADHFKDRHKAMQNQPFITVKYHMLTVLQYTVKYEIQGIVF